MEMRLPWMVISEPFKHGEDQESDLNLQLGNIFSQGWIYWYNIYKNVYHVMLLTNSSAYSTASELRNILFQSISSSEKKKSSKKEAFLQTLYLSPAKYYKIQ